MKTALLISTYNWPKALNVVLRSLVQQITFPDEVIVADDGSGEATRILLDEYKEKIPVPLRHVWQEDVGFRKSAILNKAIAATAADYIIQIDGDCIMNRYFVQDHRDLAEENVYVFGSRVNIKPEYVPLVLEVEKTHYSFSAKEIKNKTRNLRIVLLRNNFEKQDRFSGKTRGCNISYWRKDFIAVNGYDETIEGWGREDSEFVLRLLNNGVNGKRLRYGGIVYHIYHPEKSKDKLAENHQIQERTILEKRTWCSNGVDKYLASPSGKEDI